MWCFDDRHNTDTEFDGELTIFATQTHILILLTRELIPYYFVATVPPNILKTVRVVNLLSV